MLRSRLLGDGLFCLVFNYFHGFISVAARPTEVHCSQGWTWTHLRSLAHVRYQKLKLGWRIYMEDAHINVSPLNNSKNSLFGVFDGHGGSSPFTQDPKLPPLSSDTSSKNSKATKIIRQPSTRTPWRRFLCVWTSSWLQRKAERRLPLFKSKWGKKITVPNIRKNPMPGALPTLS